MRDRAPITIRNRTNYFVPDKDKAYISLANPNSYTTGCAKQLGYKMRLYYEFQETERLGGQTFFYTLTYCDAKLPRDPFLGLPCFDYLHLAHLLNGGFKKQLERKYGTQLKYFVGGELGEGKGSRGMENNPHYHVLFFLTPKFDSPIEYQTISPYEFRHLVRLYWQGFDQEPEYDGYHSFKDCLYGIAKEGSQNLGKVEDFRACTYCAKYVTKDISLRKREFRIEKYLTDKYLNSGDKPETAESKVKDAIRIYRNRYCNKVRISQGVGLSALEKVDDLMNPYIPLPQEKGFKPFRPSLYLYRKLYMDVRKDAQNKNIYVLNDLGLQYKQHKLDSSIRALTYDIMANVSVVDRKLFDAIINSDLNVGARFSYDNFKSFEIGFDIYKRYSIYKLVYEGRFFNINTRRQDYISDIGYVDYHCDYSRFIQPSCDFTDYNPDRLSHFIESDCQGFLPYDSLPYFRSYIRLFHFFDLCSDYLFVKEDTRKEKDYLESRRLKQFHNKEKLRNYYKQFN